jgi:hypothetical protein
MATAGQASCSGHCPRSESEGTLRRRCPRCAATERYQRGGAGKIRLWTAKHYTSMAKAGVDKLKKRRRLQTWPPVPCGGRNILRRAPKTYKFCRMLPSDGFLPSSANR